MHLFDASSAAPLQSTTDLSGNVVVDFPCDSTVYVKAAVYITGGTAFNAKADAISTANVVGFVESKSSAVLCNIRFCGLTLSVFSGLDVSKEYFLSSTTAGAISSTPPTAVAGHVEMQLGKPLSATELIVMISSDRIEFS